MSSSPSALLTVLEAVETPSPLLSTVDSIRLLQVLRSVPDPRRARGVVRVSNRCSCWAGRR